MTGGVQEIERKWEKVGENAKERAYFWEGSYWNNVYTVCVYM